MVPPLLASILQPDEAWNRQRIIRCECGADTPLWEKRCCGCRRKNSFRKLLKKKKRVERCFDKILEKNVVQHLNRQYLLLQNAERFNATLLEIQKRPFPERMKTEDLNRFSKRVITFFESLFKTTSPTKLAKEINAQLDKSANALSLIACEESTQILSAATSQKPAPFSSQQKQEQADKIHADLLQMSKPLFKALKTMQIYHKRMIAAYQEAHPILSRDHSTGRSKALWNKARSKLKSVGSVLNFGTAIWNNNTEHELLERFDAELSRFHEQIGRFQKPYEEMLNRKSRLLRTQTLSFRKHLILRLTDQIANASSQDRRKIIDNVLNQKGIGNIFWRWWKRLYSSQGIIDRISITKT